MAEPKKTVIKADLAGMKIHPASAARWNDLETLFGERGACGGCWCMAWRLRNKDWVAGKGAKNRRALKRLVVSGQAPGVIAYLGREPIGWCAVAPRHQYRSLAHSRVLKPVDEQTVWSISCLFVNREYRRRGISVQLLRAAVDFAGTRGARLVEGYPTVPTMEKTPDPFIWTGVPSAFTRAGFREVARRSKVRPIMRRAVSRRKK